MRLRAMTIEITAMERADCRRRFCEFGCRAADVINSCVVKIRLGGWTITNSWSQGGAAFEMVATRKDTGLLWPCNANHLRLTVQDSIRALVVQ